MLYIPNIKSDAESKLLTTTMLALSIESIKSKVKNDIIAPIKHEVNFLIEITPPCVKL